MYKKMCGIFQVVPDSPNDHSISSDRGRWWTGPDLRADEGAAGRRLYAAHLPGIYLHPESGGRYQGGYISLSRHTPHRHGPTCRLSCHLLKCSLDRDVCGQRTSFSPSARLSRMGSSFTKRRIKRLAILAKICWKMSSEKRAPRC